MKWSTLCQAEYIRVQLFKRLKVRRYHYGLAALVQFQNGSLCDE